jgi:formate C-acetyltransferase
MTIATSQQIAPEAVTPPWHGFKTSLWQKDINVRDFIQQNYEPYGGDGAFLTPATERTTKFWHRLNELFLEERKKGVLDISQIPSSITAHGPGYIDREKEVIVGLQTEAPLSGPSCRTAAFGWF